MLKIPIYIGATVLYLLTEEEKKALHTLGCNSSDELPATVVAVWGPECCNVKVHIDGPVGDLWKTSILPGDQPGHYKHIGIIMEAGLEETTPGQ